MRNKGKKISCRSAVKQVLLLVVSAGISSVVVSQMEPQVDDKGCECVFQDCKFLLILVF